jgi:hypothetical protein
MPVDQVSKEIRKVATGLGKVAKNLERQNNTLLRLERSLQKFTERVDDISKKEDVESEDAKDHNATD